MKSLSKALPSSQKAGCILFSFCLLCTTITTITKITKIKSNLYINDDTFDKISRIRNINLKHTNASLQCYDGTQRQNISLPVFPHFIIVGAQKAGTTAISEMMDSVPNFLKTKRSEPHFWDGDINEEVSCGSLVDYFAQWDFRLIKPTTITFEKTPSLLAIAKTPKLIDHLLPHKPKIIAILRHPVDRLYSQYKMEMKRGKNKKNKKDSFENKLIESIDELRRKKVIRAPPYSDATTNWNQDDFEIGEKVMRNYKTGKSWGMVSRGFYSQQIRNYMSFFPINETFKIIHYESFQKNKSAVLQDLVRFVGGPSSFEFSEQLIQKNLSPGRKHIVLFPPMSNNTKVYLKHLYKPFNDDLADLLGESWRGVWD